MEIGFLRPIRIGGNLQVNRVATMFIETALESERVNSLAAKMKFSDIGFLPVVGADGQVRGIVTDRDVVVRVIADDRDPREVTAADIMSEPVRWVYADAELKDACHLMAEHKVRRLLICDHQHRPLGVLSLDDIARHNGSDQVVGHVLEHVAQPPSIAPTYFPE
ncbi:MAG: CBS domain-containing protein [Fimbriimonas sp.]